MNEEALICQYCMGSGEGMYPDTRCSFCKGTGEEPSTEECQDEAERDFYKTWRDKD